MSIAKTLSKTLGGKWTYDGVCSWVCDDGERQVTRTHCGAFDHQGEAIDGPPHYWLYGFGLPQRAEQYMFGERKSIKPQSSGR